MFRLVSNKRFSQKGPGLQTVNSVLTADAGKDGLGQCINGNLTFSDVNYGTAKLYQHSKVFKLMGKDKDSFNFF